LVPGRDGVSVDQGAIRGSRRSNPATYLGLLDPIRKPSAKADGVKPALLERRLRGRLRPNCNGAGVVYTDLAMMAAPDLLENCSEHLLRRRPARHQRRDPPQRRLLGGQGTQILTAQLRSHRLTVAPRDARRRRAETPPASPP
jgi:hypothetical protein